MASPAVSRLAIAAAITVAFLFQTTSYADHSANAAGNVQQKVAELNRQLGQGPNAVAWRKFLSLAELEAQLAAPATANREVVEEVLARFSGSEPKLAWGPVVAVRQSLTAWIAAFPPPPAADLPKLLRDAKAGFKPHAPGAVEAARNATSAALAQLNRYLAGGSQGPGWSAYLYLEALDAQLKNATPDPEELRQIQRQFISGKVGLELPIFANVGRALDTYLDRLTTVDNPKTREQFAQQIDALAAGIEKIGKEPTTGLAEAYQWLSVADQVRPLLAAVRHYYSRPNLRVEVSEGFLASRANRTVLKTSAVRDTILGTRITGTGQTTAELKLDLVPDSDRAVYDLLLSGNVASTTVGRNGPAIIHSKSGTAFSTRKRVLLDSTGVIPLEAQTAARTSSTTTGVGVTIRVPVVKQIVQKIAEKKVAEKRGQGNAVGARLAERKISSGLDNEVANEIAKANQKFQDTVVLPARRYGQAPDQLRFSTTDTLMQVVGMHATRLQLAAPIEPPAVDGVDLAVRLHESALNNIAESIAGQTWQDQHLKEQLKKMGVKIPKKWEPETEEEQEPGTITFADEKPMTMVVADGGVTLTIRAQGFTRGEKQHEGMDITVTYKLVKGDKGVVARRTGEIRVRPPGFVQGKDKLSLGQTTVVKLVEKTFSKIFEEEKSIDILVDEEGPKPDKLVATVHSAEKGWLALGWIRETPPRTARNP